MVKPIHTILIIIVIAIITAITSSYIWQQSHQSTDEQQKENQTIDQESSNAEWQTYINEEYGYEINYPNNWYSYTSDPADVFFQPNEEILGDIPGPYARAFEIKIESLPADKSLSQVLDEKCSQIGIDFSRNDYPIGGENGFKVIPTCEGAGCGIPEWFVAKNNHLYHFNSNLEYSETFDQILSTFKFNK